MCHPVTGISIDDLIAQLPFADSVGKVNGDLSHSQKRNGRVRFASLYCLAYYQRCNSVEAPSFGS